MLLRADVEVDVQPGSEILIAGAGELVGSAVARRLSREGFDRLLRPARAELDLTDQAAVYRYFER